MVTLGVALCRPAFHTYYELSGEVNIREQSEWKAEISFHSLEEFRSPGALQIFIYFYFWGGWEGGSMCVKPVTKKKKTSGKLGGKNLFEKLV